MAADNTSGYNCRYAVADGAPQWSNHAYGRAIDVNPVENPYVFDGEALPPNGAVFVDRTERPGMLVEGGAALQAFLDAGFFWGGVWGTSPRTTSTWRSRSRAVGLVDAPIRPATLADRERDASG